MKLKPDDVIQKGDVAHFYGGCIEPVAPVLIGRRVGDYTIYTIDYVERPEPERKLILLCVECGHDVREHVKTTPECYAAWRCQLTRKQARRAAILAMVEALEKIGDLEFGNLHVMLEAKHALAKVRRWRQQ